MASKKKTAEKSTPKRQYVVVRTYSAGVHVGELVSRNGSDVVLANARRVWSWKGALTLNEMANAGVAPGSRVSAPVVSSTLTGAIEILVCAPAGRSNLEAATWSP